MFAAAAADRPCPPPEPSGRKKKLSRLIWLNASFDWAKR